MDGKIYHEKLDTIILEPLTDIEKKAVADKIIDLRRNGSKKDYKGFKEYDRLSRFHIVSIAAVTVLNDRTKIKLVDAVYQEILNEEKAFEATSPLDSQDLTEYKQKLIEQKIYLDEIEWVNGLKAEYGASSFPDLQKKLEPLGIKI